MLQDQQSRGRSGAVVLAAAILVVIAALGVFSWPMLRESSLSVSFPTAAKDGRETQKQLPPEIKAQLLQPADDGSADAGPSLSAQDKAALLGAGAQEGTSSASQLTSAEKQHLLEATP